jgi:hypothetical protein
MQDVVRRVDRDQPEDVLAVGDPDDRHELVDETERERHGLRRPAPGEDGQQDRAGSDVDEVVDAVDLEADERPAVDPVTGVE